MHLKINGEERQVEDFSTLVELLRRLDVPTDGVAVSLNGEVIPRSRLLEAKVHAGDAVEIVRAVGGG